MSKLFETLTLPHNNETALLLSCGGGESSILKYIIKNGFLLIVSLKADAQSYSSLNRN